MHPREAVQHLIQAILQATGGALNDDATALCLDWHGGPVRERTTDSGANESWSADYVDKYTGFGQTVQRIASRGNLNAPWGLAIAPASFGKYAGSLLVGNFGDGRVGAYTDDGEFAGFLRDGDNKVIAIDGLWGLLAGTATSGGTDSLWFSAGPDDETHGLVGVLRPTG